MPRIAQAITLVSLIILATGVSITARGTTAWHVYGYSDGSFVALGDQVLDTSAIGVSASHSCPLADMPSLWHVLTSLRADLTHDGVLECVLLVWRPWRDWPIMQWSDTLSPIATNRDAGGDSAHIILIGPSDHRELWAGSALVLPIIQIAAGDLDGDGGDELIALEGNYVNGRNGPASHVAVWDWNGFGFTLEWRSTKMHLVALAVADVDNDDTDEILIR